MNAPPIDSHRPLARARLIEARVVLANVIPDLGTSTDLRDRLRGLVSRIDEILSSQKYLPDMPALPKEGP